MQIFFLLKLLDRASASSSVEVILGHEEDDQMQNIVLERKWTILFIAIMKIVV